MKNTLLVSALALICSVAAANAALISIAGTPGDGFVTITLSGDTQPVGPGTIRDTSANNFRAGANAEDSMEFADFIVDTGISDTVFATTGNLTVSFDGTTVPIHGIFLDHDDPLVSGGPSQSDFGFRSDTGLSYSVLPGERLIFDGAGTIAVDIASFQTPYSSDTSFATQLSSTDQFQLEITDLSAVPLPAGLPLLAMGGVALAVVGRRRKA